MLLDCAKHLALSPIVEELECTHFLGKGLGDLVAMYPIRMCQTIRTLMDDMGCELRSTNIQSQMKGKDQILSNRRASLNAKLRKLITVHNQHAVPSGGLVEKVSFTEIVMQRVAAASSMTLVTCHSLA